MSYVTVDILTWLAPSAKKYTVNEAKEIFQFVAIEISNNATVQKVTETVI